MKSSDQIEAEGGPAFAYGSHEHGGDPGMTLRDWFAGQALAGLAASWSKDANILAHMAYKIADAMVAKRTE